MGARELNWLDVVRDACLGLVDAAALPTGALALARVPRSDGRAVLVLPGYLSTDRPTALIRWFLSAIGYRTFPWELGVNLGFATAHYYDTEMRIEHRLKDVFHASGGRKVSLVGWSLGGLYAKVLARRHPRFVREIITLGSPISGDPAEASVAGVYEWLGETRVSDPVLARRFAELGHGPRSVPVTAIYSKADGVVPWRNAREPRGPRVQNVEVKATHLGMGFDAFVLYLIAHRLAQSAGRTWRPLRIAALKARFARERLPL